MGEPAQAVPRSFELWPKPQAPAPAQTVPQAHQPSNNRVPQARPTSWISKTRQPPASASSNGSKPPLVPPPAADSVVVVAAPTPVPAQLRPPSPPPLRLEPPTVAAAVVVPTTGEAARAEAPITTPAPEPAPAVVADNAPEEVAPAPVATAPPPPSKPAPRRRPPPKKNSAAAVAAQASQQEDGSAPSKPHRKPPPPSNVARIGTNNRAAVLYEQCTQPPTAQLTRFEEAIRVDLKREYTRSLYEHLVLDVVSNPALAFEKALEETQRAAAMFTVAANTSEILRGVGDSLLTDYFGSMASFTRGTGDNAHNGAQDFYVAEQALNGVHHERYTPIEQEQLVHLRKLEAMLSGVGRKNAFERISNRGGAGGAAKNTEEITEEDKARNALEKARLFHEQEQVLSGAYAEKRCEEATQEMFGHFCNTVLDPAKVGEDVAEYATFIAMVPTTLYNISRQVDIEVEVAKRRVTQAALTAAATAAVPAPASAAVAPAPAPPTQGTKRGRARTPHEECYKPGAFTVTPAPPQRRKTKAEKESEFLSEHIEEVTKRSKSGKASTNGDVGEEEAGGDS